MSILGCSSRIFTFRPSIKNCGERLVIKNGLVVRCLTLFLFLRKVEIFFDQRLLIYSVTRFLFFRRIRVINFDELSHIDYSYGSSGTSWGMTASGFGRQDQIESFSISLITHRKEKLAVCTFMGEGAVSTGWIGVILGDDVIDAHGTQEDESRELACYLSEQMDLPIGEPMVVSIYTASCPSCGRRMSKLSVRCLYCGSKVTGAC